VRAGQLPISRAGLPVTWLPVLDWVWMDLSNRWPMLNRKTDIWPALIHSVRTASVAVISLFVARLFRQPEAYWAPITTVVITQSSLGAALPVSLQRFVGTALGAVVGAIAASYLGDGMLIFGAGVFLLGCLCAIVGSDRPAYRFGGVTLAIVLLKPREAPAWLIAFHRCAEVSIGIVVALIFSVLWPEKEDTHAVQN
jgi:uncharacterized membrane protein YccC